VSLAVLLDDPDETLRAWPSKPTLYHRHPKSFRPLLTREEVDDLIDNDCLAMRNVALLAEGKPVDPRRYADGDMPRRGALRQHLDEGGTISLRGLERLKPSLAILHREVALETGYRTHVNAYYTPAGQQGLRYHFDPYVTLILQIAGQKAWPTHRPFVENPVREYDSYHLIGFTEAQLHFLANTPPAETYTLEPGDVFWLPRGYVHAPYAVGDEPSLHITLALKERTWQWVAAQLAEDVVAEALRDPAMREAIAPAVLLGDPREVIRDARDYLVGALRARDPEEAAKRLRRVALEST
jgi:ribosomal protein L16 Arg81 hydroxylase